MSGLVKKENPYEIVKSNKWPKFKFQKFLWNERVITKSLLMKQQLHVGDFWGLEPDMINRPGFNHNSQLIAA